MTGVESFGGGTQAGRGLFALDLLRPIVADEFLAVIRFLHDFDRGLRRREPFRVVDHGVRRLPGGRILLAAVWMLAEVVRKAARVCHPVGAVDGSQPGNRR